ncbi:MAG: sigma-E processing peptidase SpoIIGA [Ruminococcus sp.]|nr:sigma-E processing peptidase SpoIIGA [Ruminococcus sp.]
MFENYLLLLGVKYILKLKHKTYRLILGSLCGAVLSFVVFIPVDNFFINLISLAAICVVTVLISFGFFDKRIFIKTAMTLLVLTFLFSGAMIFLYLAIRPKGMVIINNRPYFDISPVLLIILTIIIYFILLIYKKLFKNRASAQSVHSIKFIYDGKEYNFLAKADSGCNVKEPFSGSSVIICEKSAIDTELKTEKKRIIPFESLGGKGIIYGFKADEIYIDDKKCHEEVYIGLCEGIFETEIKGLVPESLLGG